MADRSRAEWNPPPENSWKINVDAAWYSSSIGVGTICKNSLGNIIGVAASFYDLEFTPLLDELRAISEGVKLGILLGGVNIIVESDCLEAVNLVSREKETWNEAKVLVEEIWQLAKILRGYPLILFQENVMELLMQLPNMQGGMNVWKCGRIIFQSGLYHWFFDQGFYCPCDILNTSIFDNYA